MGSFDFGSAAVGLVEDSAAVGLVEDWAVEDWAVEDWAVKDAAVGSAAEDSAEVDPVEVGSAAAAAAAETLVVAASADSEVWAELDTAAGLAAGSVAGSAAVVLVVDSAEGSAVEDLAEVGLVEDWAEVDPVEVGSAAAAAAAETLVVAASADSEVWAKLDTAAGLAAGSVAGSAAVVLAAVAAVDSAADPAASAEDRMVAARDSFHHRTRRYRTARARNIARRSPTPRRVDSPETKSYTPTRRVFLLPSPRARRLARAPLARTDASIPVSLDATRKPSRVALVSSYLSRAPLYLCLGARRRRN